MADVLEFSDIFAEIKGALCPVRLKLTEDNIVYKNVKTGKVEQIPSSELDVCNWQKLVGNYALRLFLKSGTLHRFCGFRESEQDKVAKFFKNKYSYELLEKELCLKGWNWGTAKFLGSVLSFDINNTPAFEIPLAYVSQCHPAKNEVTVEFHQDDAPVSLMEMRFHIPTSELAGDDPIEAFHSQVMNKASVISASGDAIAIFREIQCLTPRGRYDIKMFQSFFQLHGKTFDYKIPMNTVIRLFVLPHKDGRQNFFVMSLDPPIKQGQTRYHYLVFLFGQDEETSIELPFTEEELKEKYEGKLTPELSGPTYDVISRVMKTLVNRKLTMPTGFVGHSGTPAIGCSYKAAAGYMYPLDKGFIYIHKPPLHIRFEEIASVNFARSGGSTRSFDFELELKSGVVHTFSSIEKEEYPKLSEFIKHKKLRIKNKAADKHDYKEDFGDSDVEGDPYLERVKREAQERDEDDAGNDDDSDESEDEDFKPTEQGESDVAEEFDSNPSTSSDEDSDASGGSSKEKKIKEKKEKKTKTKTISEKPRKQRKAKKDRDENKPKRAPTAYMLWFNETRQKIIEDHPGLTFTEIAKKAGELWKKLDNKSDYEKKAQKLKEEYVKAMEEYKASGGGSKPKSSDDKSDKKRKVIPTADISKAGSGSNFKSKEFIESDSSSSGDEKSNKNSKKTNNNEAKKKQLKKEKKESSGESNEEKQKKDKKKTSKKEKASSAESSEEEEKEQKKDKKKPTKKEKKESSAESDEEEEKEQKKDKKKPTKKEKKESSAESDEEEEKEQKKDKKKPTKKEKKESSAESDEEEEQKKDKKKPTKKEKKESSAESDEEEILSTPTASSDESD